MKKLLNTLLRNEQGIAALEFILVFPLLFMMLFGGLEVARYIIIIQKVDNAAYVITDAVGQLKTPHVTPAAGEATVNTVRAAMDLYDNMMWPYNDLSRETIVISSVHQERRGRMLRWQQSKVGFPIPSSIVTGTTPISNTHRGPGGCGLAPLVAPYNAHIGGMFYDENMIVGEVYYQYTPLWRILMGDVAAATTHTNADGFTMSPQIIRRAIFLHPRNGTLIDLGNPPSQPLILPEQSDCL